LEIIILVSELYFTDFPLLATNSISKDVISVPLITLKIIKVSS